MPFNVKKDMYAAPGLIVPGLAQLEHSICRGCRRQSGLRRCTRSRLATSPPAPVSQSLIYWRSETHPVIWTHPLSIPHSRISIPRTVITTPSTL
jgi:hypothetical protein